MKLLRREFLHLTAGALTLGVARAEESSYVMKISGPTINDSPHLFEKNYGAAIERDSGGRIKAEVYPASQLGSIPRQIEGTQFGAIQAVNIPPEFFVGVDERFEVMAAPGLVNSMEHGQRLAADPAVLKLILGLGANKGLHGVGLYIAQPSCIISKTPIRHLADLPCCRAGSTSPSVIATGVAPSRSNATVWNCEAKPEFFGLLTIVLWNLRAREKRAAAPADRGAPAAPAAATETNKAAAKQSPLLRFLYEEPDPKERLRVSNWIVQRLYNYAVKETVKL